MTILGALVLSAAIGMSANRSPAQEERDAYKAISKAIYLETDTDKIVKNIERKYIPKELKEYGGWITGTTKVLVDKKISLEWTF